MRRVLRKIVSGEGDQLGDMSSLANPDSVEESESLFQLYVKEADEKSKPRRLPRSSSSTGLGRQKGRN